MEQETTIAKLRNKLTPVYNYCKMQEQFQMVMDNSDAENFQQYQRILREELHVMTDNLPVISELLKQLEDESKG